MEKAGNPVRLAYIISITFHAVLALALVTVRFYYPAQKPESRLDLYLISALAAAPEPIETESPASDAVNMPSPPEPERSETVSSSAGTTAPSAGESAAAQQSALPELAEEIPLVSESGDVEIPVTPHRFTPFADGDFSRPYADSSYLTPFQKGEILFEGMPYALHPSWKPRKGAEPVRPEDATDERREFDGEMMGIQMNGPLALIPGVKHIGKSILWDIQDANHQDHVDDMRRTMFATVNERDVRFLILMWRDGLLDLISLSRRDRTFLAAIPADRPQTNKSYLRTMYNKGLADELQVGGRVVFRATFPRTEVLSVLCYGAYDSLRVPEPESRLKLVDLITACYNPALSEIVIPDSLTFSTSDR